MANEYGYENNLNKLTPSDVYRPGIPSEDAPSDGGGNPNQQQVVTGTAANPFGNVDVSKLKSAMMAGGASATIFMDTSQLVGTSYTIPFDTPTSPTGFLTVSSAYVDTNYDSVRAVNGSWKDDGSIYALASFTNGHAVDAKEYASMIPTTLIINWHPMP